MKIGYVTSGFTNHSIYDLTKILNQLEYNGMELVLDKKHYHPYCSSISGIKKITQDYGMEVVIGTGGRYDLSDVKHEPTFVNPNEKGRKERIEFTKSAIDACIELNGSVISGHSGGLQDGVDPDEARQWLTEGLSEVQDYATERDVTFALEPVPGMLIQSIDDWRSINKKTKVGFCLDIGHAFCTEDDPISVVKKGIKIADDIHLEDIKGREHKHLMLGDGDINLDKIFSIILRSDCMINIELHDHSDVAETAAKESIDKIRNILLDIN